MKNYWLIYNINAILKIKLRSYPREKSMQRNYTHKDFKKKKDRALSDFTKCVFFCSSSQKMTTGDLQQPQMCSLNYGKIYTSNTIPKLKPEGNYNRTAVNSKVARREGEKYLLQNKASCKSKLHLNNSLALKTTDIIRLKVLIPRANMPTI